MKFLKMKPSQKRWGIVIGVDEYENAGEYLRNLKGCVADAHRMFRTMTDKDCCGFEADHVRLLENPTYAEIESAFEDLGSRMAKGDELWFYYAGHGYSERRRNGVSGYLLPSDVRLNSNGKLSTHGCISHSGLRDDFIARNLDMGNITVVLFLDCCCAASVGLADGSRSVCMDAKEMSDGFQESFRDLGSIGSVESENWDFKYISFMATDKSGKAKEDASGGVFTKCLIEGLRGGRPEFTTIGAGTSDCYVRVGRLGAFLGEHVPNQPPLQDFQDVTYPLSVSSERRSLLNQMKEMNKNAVAWLFKMMEEDLIEKDVRQFAEDVVYESDSADFKYAGMMRNLMRLFSAPTLQIPVGLKEGSDLVKAFYEMKRLMDGNLAKEKEPPVVVPSAPSVRKQQNEEPLSRRDRELAADIVARVRAVDGEDADIPDIGRMSQADAVSALDVLARNRLRTRGPALFSTGERAAWDVRSTKGFESAFEAAVYELVNDDNALPQRRTK